MDESTKIWDDLQVVTYILNYKSQHIVVGYSSDVYTPLSHYVQPITENFRIKAYMKFCLYYKTFYCLVAMHIWLKRKKQRF